MVCPCQTEVKLEVMIAARVSGTRTRKLQRKPVQIPAKQATISTTMVGSPLADCNWILLQCGVPESSLMTVNEKLFRRLARGFNCAS